MSLTVATYSFTAGELSPALRARSDLSKYGLGVATCKNFYVNHQGGLVSRPGLKFVGQASGVGGRIRLKEFRASSNSYLLVFSRNVIHVIQNGAYVLETAALPAISGITAAEPPVVTHTAAHGLVTNQLVHFSEVQGMTELNGRIFRVRNVTSTSYELYHTHSQAIDASSYTGWVSGGSVYPTVHIATNYKTNEVYGLKFFQHQNEMWITHSNHIPRKLTFTDATTWSLDDEVFGNNVTSPDNLSSTPATAGTAGYSVAVTTIDQNGAESVISTEVYEELAETPSASDPSSLYTWDAVAGALEYYVYRSLVLPVGSDVSGAQELGYIGRALSPQFSDNYITPDFTKTPPRHKNPFAGGAITYIDVTAKGSLYSKIDTVTVSGGGGSGFVGYPVVNRTVGGSGGEIIGVVVVNGGSGYSSPVVSFGTSTGSGATATVSLTPSSGNNPSVFARFEQRAVYAGSLNYPMTIWGSKPKMYTNFDESAISNASDSYEFTLDLPDITPISHLIGMKNGLVLMTETQISQLVSTGVGVSAVAAKVEPQAYRGVSTVTPVVIDMNILYTQPYGSAVYELAYTFYTNSFAVRDMSVLASHLFDTTRKSPRSLSYAEEPDKLLHFVRDDGRLLTMTYAPDQELYAWSQHWTNGIFHTSEVVRESTRSVTYVVVSRVIDGEVARHIEYFSDRAITHVEDYLGSDAGVEYALTELGVNATLTAGTGAGVTLTITSGDTPFLGSDVGSIIYVLGGKALITAVPTTNSLTLTFLRDIVPDETQGTVNDPVVTGSHFLSRKLFYGPEVTNVTGLWHLEGKAVSVLADGVEIMGRTVVGGTLDTPLATPASKILVGLPYTCQVKTLPATSSQIMINGKLRNAYAAALYLKDTKGLTTGSDFDTLYPVKARMDTDWDSTSGMRNDITEVNVRSSWDREGVFCIEQAAPYPATLLGLALEVEV